jgi:hypothetical protein
MKVSQRCLTIRRDASENVGMKNVIIDCFWFLRRFPHMATLCSHVRLDHKVGEAEVKVQKFQHYQEVEVVFIIIIITNETGAQDKDRCVPLAGRPTNFIADRKKVIII